MFCICVIAWILLLFQTWLGKQHSGLYVFFYQARKNYIKEVEKYHK